MSRENKTRSLQRESDKTTTAKYTRLKKQGTKRDGSVVNSTVYSFRKPKSILRTHMAIHDRL